MSKSIYVDGIVYGPSNAGMMKFNVMVSNDKIGKTLSINDGVTQFTIPFEPVLDAMVAEGVNSRKLDKLIKQTGQPQSSQHHKRKKKRK